MVIELGSVVAGPFAGRLLADLGADVIKIEAPDKPDPLREWGRGRSDGRALWWPVHARNKRCITLNLRDPRGQRLLLDLARRADVLIENFRPGTMERWGLGYEQLARVNGGLVMARISGFGQTGPYRDRAGFASVAEAMGGLRHINGYPGQTPPRMSISLGDSLGGILAVEGILAALYHREVAGGGGQVVDVSLMEACFSLLESAVPEYDRLGLVREPSGTGLPGVAPSNLFTSRDGRAVIIAANQDTVFARLCGAMGRPELARDPRFATHVARGERQEEIERIVAEWAATRDLADLIETLSAAGVVVGPVYDVSDIFGDPQYRARDMLVEHRDETGFSVVGPGIVPRFSRTRPAVRWAGPPTPGQHNAAIYGELLGLDEEQLDRLTRDGVI